MSDFIDLGDNHLLTWFDFDPDPKLNPTYVDMPHLEEGEHFGAIISHFKPDGSPCEGSITFDTAPHRYLVAKHDARDVSWEVQSWEPLTVSPSILCSCGDHGFVKNGQWRRA